MSDKQPIEMTPGELLEYRRNRQLCIECGADRPMPTKDSGFLQLRCDRCERRRAEAAAAEKRARARAR